VSCLGEVRCGDVGGVRWCRFSSTYAGAPAFSPIFSSNVKPSIKRDHLTIAYRIRTPFSLSEASEQGGLRGFSPSFQPLSVQFVSREHIAAHEATWSNIRRETFLHNGIQ
jgi:hypothetical protein